jgi:DNA-binding LytR/AlgR family response regulator
VTRARLAVCVEHLRRIPAAEWDLAVERIAGGSAMGTTRFLARCGAKYRVVGQKEVEYFSFEEGFTVLHTAAGRFAMDPTLNVLESRLDSTQFFRISRGVIVRLDAVLEVAPLIGGYGEVQLRNGMRFPVSRRRFRKLLEELEGRGAAKPR